MLITYYSLLIIILGREIQCKGTHIYVLGRRARVLVLAAWLLSILFSTPIFVLYEERLVQGKSDPNNWDLSEELSATSFRVLPWHFCHNALDIKPTQVNYWPRLRYKDYHETTHHNIRYGRNRPTSLVYQAFEENWNSHNKTRWSWVYLQQSLNSFSNEPVACIVKETSAIEDICVEKNRKRTDWQWGGWWWRLVFYLTLVYMANVVQSVAKVTWR